MIEHIYFIKKILEVNGGNCLQYYLPSMGESLISNLTKFLLIKNYNMLVFIITTVNELLRKVSIDQSMYYHLHIVTSIM